MHHLTFLTLAAVLVSGGVATAEPRSSDPVMVVKISGVDLQTTGGAALVMARINRAAAQFCQGSDNPREMSLYADTLRCRREMTEKAVHKLDAPRVTALYNGRALIQFASR